MKEEVTSKVMQLGSRPKLKLNPPLTSQPVFRLECVERGAPPRSQRR